jgi:hypothetical protein
MQSSIVACRPARPRGRHVSRGQRTAPAESPSPRPRVDPAPIAAHRPPSTSSTSVGRPPCAAAQREGGSARIISGRAFEKATAQAYLAR